MGLIGMMTKNGIVLIDEINRLYKVEKLSAYDSVVTATISRVRPVIMASLTTIVGLVPLLGDPMYGSMAVCIMAGLTMGTLITLIIRANFMSIRSESDQDDGSHLPHVSSLSGSKSV